MNDKKKNKLREELADFLQKYARKKRPGKGEPNDRHYSRKLEVRIKRMKPEEVDDLMNDSDVD